ncbi:MAG: hypothetical protein ABI471_02130 [Sphingomonas bacterium]
MLQYVYAFHLEEDDGETFFSFPSIPEIVSSIPNERFECMSVGEIYEHARDAVIVALQACIACRDALPASDDPRVVSADGFVRLLPLEAMKLVLYTVYFANCSSISDFARQIRKQDTAARRLLNLRHQSKTSEIEEALVVFNKRFVHSWGTEPASETLTQRIQTLTAAAAMA